MVRYLDLGGVRVPLGHFRFGKIGEDNTTAADITTALIGLPGLFITGGEVRVPVGTHGVARTTADVDVAAAKPDPAKPQEPTT